MNTIKKHDNVRFKKSYVNKCGINDHRRDYYVFDVIKVETYCKIKYIASIVDLLLSIKTCSVTNHIANIDITHLYNTDTAFEYYLNHGHFPNWSE